MVLSGTFDPSGGDRKYMNALKARGRLEERRKQAQEVRLRWKLGQKVSTGSVQRHCDNWAALASCA